MGNLFSGNGYAQDDSWNVDSLYHNISIASGEEKVDLYNKIASLYYNNIDSVFYFTELAISKSEDMNYDIGTADAYFIRGEKYYMTGNIAQSNKWKNAALRIYLKIGNQSKISNCINSIGTNYIATSDYDSALITFNKVLLYNDSIEIAYSFLKVGTLLENTGNDQKALEYCHKSIRIFERYNDESGLAGNYIVISRVLSHQHEYDRALDYINKAIRILKTKVDRTSYAHSLNELALLYSNTNKPQEAIKSYKEALRLHEELNNMDGIASVNFNLCLSYLTSGDLARAKYYYSVVDSISADLEDKYLKCDVLWLTSDIAKAEGDKIRSIDLLNKSLNIAIELSSWTTIAKLSRLLSKLNKENGNYYKALEYNEIFINANDSLMNLEMIRELEQLKFSNDFTSMESELELKKTKIQFLEIEKDNIRKIYLLIIIGSIMLITFAGFSFFRQKKINRIQKRAMDSEKALMHINLEQEKLKMDRLNEVIVYKNKLLTDLAIHITEKNDLLERFKENVKSIKKSVLGKKVTELLQGMLVNISQDIDINKERLEFNKEIETLNQNFLYTLSTKYPGLTDRELKLAALLRVNLSSKRIATLMGITPESVDVYRHYLRKKLGLQKNELLSEFFKKMG